MALVWLNVLVLEPRERQLPKRLPSITIVIPAYNEEENLVRTVESVVALRYPRRLLEIIIVDDCSTDRTLAKARWLQRVHPEVDIKILRHAKNQGKVGGMNTGLTHARGELFACLDAETHVHPDSLTYLVRHVTRKNIGAVIGQVKVDSPRNLYERLQRVEYILSNFIRRLWSNMSTLFIAPGGALSLFRTQVVRELGGFVNAGMTEDLEIALRLKANGYEVYMEPRAITYTKVPANWHELWNQRIRWYRGFVVNHINYRNLFFRRSHGLFSTFQLPMNVLGVLLLLLTMVLVSYGGLRDLSKMVYRSLTIDGYFLNHVLDFPTMKELLLGQNVQIMLPLVLGVILGLYLILLAHRRMQESLFRHLPYALLYVWVVPYVTTVHWVSALMQEAVRARRKW
jgi:cellulose synthase/poly-beta-1,6-N-acetylglucosamine synthase-like glycosyltransferase